MHQQYMEMRSMALKLGPEEIPVWLDNGRQVYKAVVDIRLKQEYVTLLCVCDGSVSLYYSTGKMHIGLGSELETGRAALSFLISSGQCLDKMKETQDFALDTAYMQVYLFTAEKTYHREIRENSQDKIDNFLNFLVQHVIGSIQKK